MAYLRNYLGSRELEITCADVTLLLNSLNTAGVRLSNITYDSDLTVLVTVTEWDYERALDIIQKHGASAKELGAHGLYRLGIAMLKRPVLLAVFFVLLFLVCYIPGRVFFVSVEGNSSVPTRLILEAAAECGIEFGASRRQVRSEKMKNALLEKIPQLQWAGINTVGCNAVISVREKTVSDTEDAVDNAVCSIVASRDGVIQSCTVLQGNPLCAPGQAVKAGQTLVSGYTDCGIVTKATCADAEIIALTFRDLEVITPACVAERGQQIKQINNYSLIIGKKLIKLSKDSGNFDTGCVKIYSEKYMQLPGGFCLPVAIVKETCYFYENTAASKQVSTAPQWLNSFTRSHLQSAMIAGKILSAQEEIQTDENASYLYGKYACIEMIGKTVYEQNLTKDGEND